MQRRQRMWILVVLWMVWAVGMPVAVWGQSISLVESVQREVAGHLGDVSAETVIVSNVRESKGWAFGTAAVPMDVRAGASSFLFIAQQSSDSWQVTLNAHPNFQSLIHQLPEGLISAQEKQILGGIGLSGDGSSQLSLPWATGETQNYTSGPHGKPRSAVDFSGGSGIVRAAREGVAYLTCANQVFIAHADGWETGYYHLTDIKVANGQSVQRGQELGRQSTQVGCGGYAGGPHVHFWLQRHGSEQPLHGKDIGGWTIEDGATDYAGDMVRVRDGYRVTASFTTEIYNEGLIGSGTPPPPPNQPPNIPTLTEPVPDQLFTSTTPVTLKWADAGDPDNGPNPARQFVAQLFRNGELRAATDWGAMLEWNVGVLPPGTYTWRVKARDGAAESDWTAQRTFRVNAPPNRPTLTEPTNGLVTSQRSVRLAWQDNGDPDNSPRASREFFGELLRDGTRIAQSDWINATTWQHDNLADGLYEWRVQSGDGAESSGWSTMFRFRVDTTAPTLSDATLNYGWGTAAQAAVPLRLTASDAGSGVATFRIAETCAALGDNWQPYRATSSVTLSGQHGDTARVCVQVKDTAGNVSATLERTITLDFYPAQPSSAGYCIAKDVQGTGGVQSGSASYRLGSTSGQAIASSKPASSPRYQLTSGFWPLREAVPPIDPTRTPTPTATATPGEPSDPTLTPTPTATATSTTVTPTPTNTPVAGAPSFTVNFPNGAPGSSFVFTAAGFTSGSTMQVEVKEPTSDSYRTVLRGLEFAANTQLVFVLYVPETAPMGTYTVRIIVTPPGASLAQSTLLEQPITVMAPADGGTVRERAPNTDTAPVAPVAVQRISLPLIVRGE